MSEDFPYLVQVPVLSVKRETDLAILVRTEEKETWIPKSQIDEESEVTRPGHHGMLVIPRWLAEEKDMHYEEL